jgi:methylated-DNA-protein-cysteine methyltransferase related protein
LKKTLRNRIKDPLFDDGNSFFEKIYQLVRQIPYGRVTSYGAIARYLGSAGASRMVGWAMNQSHGVIPAVPAHRVVNRNGVLTGKYHFGDENEMKNRLEQEGIKVCNNTVVCFTELFWDPLQEEPTA